MILAFINEMRAEGYAVESILRVLRQQGLKIAARTYRAWRRPARIAARTVTDALVEDKIRALAWKVNEATGQVEMTPEGLYGRRKWVARAAGKLPGRHVTRRCGPGDADPRTRGRAPGEEAAHHHPRSGRKTGR